ncbi:uncharacterized protein [Porites lutea]|uniref:uncharacterized protein n=1 Tax=Porites lutea TaxID=51062 RepID=UPI003CC5E62A
MYKSLMDDDANFQGFYLEESASSTRNKGVFSVIADVVSNDYGGSEQCPWSPAQLRASYVTYLRSLKDTRKRRGKVDHNTVCRRQGRVREKIVRRVAVVDRMGWDEAKREKVKKCLTIHRIHKWRPRGTTWFRMLENEAW